MVVIMGWSLLSLGSGYLLRGITQFDCYCINLQRCRYEEEGEEEEREEGYGRGVRIIIIIIIKSTITLKR